MPGANAKSGPADFDEYGFGLVVSDIERIFQLLRNEPGTVLPLDTQGGQLSIQTLDVCVDGVAMKIDVLASAPYSA